MASMVAGVQYGMHTNFNENKSLVFVKLTDSAQRAIEDFLRNRNKLQQNPTIQFNAGGGRLSFPSSQSSNGATNFTFSLSDNQDIEGPQGAFECIQQTGTKSLESLGTLQNRMRIHANDDVYETTRHRMAVAEENNKNKCTRMIKANGPNIGRKVKVQGTSRTIPPLPTNVKSRETITPSISSTNSSRFSSSTSTPSSRPMSSSSSRPISSSSSRPMSRNPPPARSKTDKLLSDIARTPIRERLIHLLALRPYKKPEIYERINREGCKDKDRSKIFEHLTEIAFNRDNAYHLKRAVWNDVRDNWIHYSEEEKSLLKRRKPQNLTPPGSSDGSSGSGQSPNSVHPGSPPAITAPPPGFLKSKRPGYYEGNDGLPTKKPRISHYRKPEPTFVNHGDNRRTADGSGYNGESRVYSGDSRVNSGDNRLTSGDSRLNSGYSHLNSGDNRLNNGDNRLNNGDSRLNSGDSRFNSADSRINSAERVSGNDRVISGSNRSTCNSRSSLFAGQNSNWNQREQSRDNCTERTTSNEVLRGSSYPSENLCLSASDSEDDQNQVTQKHQVSASDRRNDGNSANNQFDAAGTSGIAYDPTTSPNSSNNVTINASTQTTQSEVYPDYYTYYTKVSSYAQRSRYKEEFNSIYPKYKELYDAVNPTFNRYKEFTKKFEETKAMRNMEHLEYLRLQILRDYQTIHHDLAYREKVRRKDYLEGKLNYLRSLIEEYDVYCIANNVIHPEKENSHY